MLKRTLIAICVSGLGMTACEPGPYDSNASDPSNTTRYWASETSVLHFRYAGEDRVLLGYNDQAGFERIVGDTVTPVARPSAAGLSLSKDAGRTWTKLEPLRPPASCPPSGPCINLIAADPWLATNGVLVLYSRLASTTRSFEATDTIAIGVSIDGESWSDPIPAVHRPGRVVDKQSLAMFGETAILGFVDLVEVEGREGESRLVVATSDDNGITWDASQTLTVPIEGAPTRRFPTNPIIKLRSRTEALLAYVTRDRSVEETGGYRFDVHVVRLFRSQFLGRFSPWTVARNEVFRSLQVPLDPTLDVGQGFSIRDAIPMSFDVANRPSGNHLYVTFREHIDPSSDSSSQVVLFDCVMVGSTTCRFDFGWRERRPNTQRTLQYQPAVAADSVTGNVALAWYQARYEEGETYSTGLLTAHGVYLTAEGETMSGVNFLRPRGVDWTPCPRQRGYYGDYIGSAIVPGLVASGGKPWIVTAYTESGRTTNTSTIPQKNDCTLHTKPGVVFDHHVQAVVWP
jgi:hypothetical protein